MSQVDINTTISALQQGLTSIPAEQAVTVIEGWQQQLQGNPIAFDFFLTIDKGNLC